MGGGCSVKRLCSAAGGGGGGVAGGVWSTGGDCCVGGGCGQLKKYPKLWFSGDCAV